MAVQPLANGSAGAGKLNGDALYEEVAESLVGEAAMGEAEGDEEPLYVNAKQYQRILKRREVSLSLQSRFSLLHASLRFDCVLDFISSQLIFPLCAQIRLRLESTGRIPHERRKYLHESRHRHAMNRVRGEGGRFESRSKKQRGSNSGSSSASLAAAISASASASSVGGGASVGMEMEASSQKLVHLQPAAPTTSSLIESSRVASGTQFASSIFVSKIWLRCEFGVRFPNSTYSRKDLTSLEFRDTDRFCSVDRMIYSIFQ